MHQTEPPIQALGDEELEMIKVDALKLELLYTNSRHF